jgi:Glutaredoxin-like domain (DUF836)
MIDFVLYGRKDCHLCDEMKQDVERVSSGFPVSLTVVDVDSDAALADRFGMEVPVLMLNGRKIAKIKIAPAKLRWTLVRARLRDRITGDV